MFWPLIIVCVIISFLLILVILMQSSKGSGLAGSFGGANNFGTVFGTRRTADFLSKATWWLVGILIVLIILINLIVMPSYRPNKDSESKVNNTNQQTQEKNKK